MPLLAETDQPCSHPWRMALFIGGSFFRVGFGGATGNTPPHQLQIKFWHVVNFMHTFMDSCCSFQTQILQTKAGKNWRLYRTGSTAISTTTLVPPRTMKKKSDEVDHKQWTLDESTEIGFIDVGLLITWRDHKILNKTHKMYHSYGMPLSNEYML